MVTLTMSNLPEGTVKKDFRTLQEAHDFLSSGHHRHEFDYQIRDKETNELFSDGFIDASSSDTTIGMTMDDMFPDEDSMEGFDWTFE